MPIVSPLEHRKKVQFKFTIEASMQFERENLLKSNDEFSKMLRSIMLLTEYLALDISAAYVMYHKQTCNLKLNNH